MAEPKKTKAAAAAKTESPASPAASAPEATVPAPTPVLETSAEGTTTAPAALATEDVSKAPKAKKTTKKDAAAPAAATEEKKVDTLSLDPNAMLEPIKIIKAK